MRAWRRGGDDIRVLREYKKLCDKKENIRWERLVEEAKLEGQVWKIVKMERKRWKRVNRNIELEEWEEYFRDLLGGVEERGRRERIVRREGRVLIAFVPIAHVHSHRPVLRNLLVPTN